MGEIKIDSSPRPCEPTITNNIRIHPLFETGHLSLPHPPFFFICLFPRAHSVACFSAVVLQQPAVAAVPDVIDRASHPKPLGVFLFPFCFLRLIYILRSISVSINVFIFPPVHPAPSSPCRCSGTRRWSKVCSCVETMDPRAQVNPSSRQACGQFVLNVRAGGLTGPKR